MGIILNGVLHTMDCRRHVLIVCFLWFVQTSDTQVDTRGQEFLLSFANNYLNKRGPSVIITNDSPDTNADVVISVKGMQSINVTVHTLSFQRVRLPIEVIVTREEMSFPAVHLTSDANITVVGINDAYENSAGGFLALPVYTLGTDYVVGSYTPWLASQILMAALEDDTEVRVRVSKSISYGYGHVSEGMVISLSLNKYEALVIEGYDDLTGTVLYSNKNIAVFSGNRAVMRPYSTSTVDHIVEQLVPFKNWGKNFVLVPYPEDEYSWNVFRVVVRNRTRVSVTTNNLLDITIDVGHFHEFKLKRNETAFVVADYPVSIFHYAQTIMMSRGKGTDMSLSNVSPIEQYVQHATFITSSEVDGYTPSNFLTITTRCDDIDKITIDSSLLNANENVFRTVNSEFCFAHAPIQHSGLHFINGSRFLSVLHSFTSTSSYAFPIALGQEAKNCKTLLPDGRFYEHDCHQEIVPVQCQYEVAVEEEEVSCDSGYTGLQVFVIALFSAGGAICIDLIIRCVKEATDPPSYGDAHRNTKWTTTVSELRERRKALRLRSIENVFQQEEDVQQKLAREQQPNQQPTTTKEDIYPQTPTTIPIHDRPTMSMANDSGNGPHMCYSQNYPDSNRTLENESEFDNGHSISYNNSYESLAYNESKV